MSSAEATVDPPCGRLHQRFEIREQGRVVLDSPLAASTRAAAPPLAAAWYDRRLTTQLLDTRVDRRPRQACRLGHQTDSASPQHHGLRRRPQPPSLLGQDRAQGLELFGDWQVICHGLDSTTETLFVKFISRRLLRADQATPGRLEGRVEHVVSGQATQFASLEDLLAFMARVLRQRRPAG